MYGDSGSASLGSRQAVLVRVRIIEQEPPDGEDHFRVGSLVIGFRKDLGVPLDWSWTDNKQPNVTSYRTRGALAWSYREGPPQRVITGRFIGDTTQRWRDELRFALDELSYEVRPLVLVTDADRPNETAVLGRVNSGSEQDNAAWYVDSDGVKRTVGDQSFTFTEEV